jgi:hypothetical protein
VNSNRTNSGVTGKGWLQPVKYLFRPLASAWGSAVLVCCFVFLLVMLLSADSQASVLPAPVRSCVEHNSHVAMIVPQKPLYLRVFFTKGSNPDYAVVVRERGSELNRVLVCLHSGDQIILGSRSDQQPFSDVADDNYVSSKWRVCSKKAVSALRKSYSDVPDPANESICMEWEDGEGLIYWDGRKFLWKGLTP